MNWELISTVLNLVLGSGFLISLVTIKAQKRRTEAEAEGAEIDNEGKAAQVMQAYIVAPLKTEINELRKDVNRLQVAIDEIGRCPYSDACPVRDKLRRSEEQTAGTEFGAEQQQEQQPAEN